jgi:hypothetical protein
MLSLAGDVILVWWHLQSLLVDARKLIGRLGTKGVHGKLNVFPVGLWTSKIRLSTMYTLSRRCTLLKEGYRGRIEDK